MNRADTIPEQHDSTHHCIGQSQSWKLWEPRLREIQPRMLVEFKKALAIRKVALDKDHPNIVSSQEPHLLGVVLREKSAKMTRILMQYYRYSREACIGRHNHPHWQDLLGDCWAGLEPQGELESCVAGLCRKRDYSRYSYQSPQFKDCSGVPQYTRYSGSGKET
jgi:hypothetical protein